MNLPQLVSPVIAVLLMGAVGCSNSSDGNTAPAQVEPARLVERPCDTAEGVAAKCWWLEVPERRDVAGARTIRLWVAVLSPKGLTGEEVPWTYINGGPGDANSADWVAGSLPLFALPQVLKKPLVVVDQRGTGRSQPHVDCPELASRVDPRLDVAERAAILLEQATTCAAELRSQGIDLDGYDTMESAVDFAELRKLLGYKQWDVYGLSYGGRLARELQHIDPEGVRRLVLDSPSAIGPGWPAAALANTEHAFNAVDAACAAGGACPEPGALLADLDAGYTRLESNPHIVPLPNGGELIVDGEQYVFGMRQVLYNPDLIPVLPAAASAVAGGNDAVIDATAQDLVAEAADPLDRNARALAAIIACADNPAPTAADEELWNAPGQWGLFFGTNTCPAWDVAIVNNGKGLPDTGGDLPVLLTLGEFDPVAPPGTEDEVQVAYPNTTVVIRPYGGHVMAFNDGCMIGMTLEFLEAATAPVLDDTCLADYADPFAQ